MIEKLLYRFILLILGLIGIQYHGTAQSRAKVDEQLLADDIRPTLPELPEGDGEETMSRISRDVVIRQHERGAPAVFMLRCYPWKERPIQEVETVFELRHTPETESGWFIRLNDKAMPAHRTERNSVWRMDDGTLVTVESIDEALTSIFVQPKQEDYSTWYWAY